MNWSDYKVTSQYNTLKRSILLCIHDEVRPLGTFESCLSVLLGQHFLPYKHGP